MSASYFSLYLPTGKQITRYVTMLAGSVRGNEAMVSNKLLDELRQLPPNEKLQIVQFLVHDLAAKAEEKLFLSGEQYEVCAF